MRPPRLVDIAAHAKVSEATVSRVLNNKPNVAESTRQSVLTALDVLGYERPLQLRRKTAGLVGLIVPELDNPIFPVLAQIIETALAVHGYIPVLCTQTPGGMHEDDYTEMLLDRGVAGMIVVSGQHADTTTSPDRYQRLRDAGLSAAEIGRLSSPIGLDLGARTPEETAISIAAEIIQGRWGGSGERLATTEGPIHATADR